MFVSVYVQFWMYFKNYFYYFFLTQLCAIRLVNMCAMFWENV